MRFVKHSLQEGAALIITLLTITMLLFIITLILLSFESERQSSVSIVNWVSALNATTSGMEVCSWVKNKGSALGEDSGIDMNNGASVEFSPPCSTNDFEYPVRIEGEYGGSHVVVDLHSVISP